MERMICREDRYNHRFNEIGRPNGFVERIERKRGIEVSNEHSSRISAENISGSTLLIYDLSSHSPLFS